MNTFTLSGNNLKIGSTGQNVSDLQSYLKAIGLYQGKVDGIFGPQTDQAVRSFQSSKGLTADGIVGPKTASATASIQSGSNPPANTLATKPPDDPSNRYNTQTGQLNTNYGNTSSTNTQPKVMGVDLSSYDLTPANKDLLAQIGGVFQSTLDQGLKINPNLNLDQGTLDKILETAKKQVKPYYQQQIDTIKQDVLREAPQILQSYQNEVAGKESQFQNDLGNARESYADRGLAFSGQRTKGELGMRDTQNRDLQNLSTDYGNKLYTLGRTAESKIGAGNSDFNLPSLRQYSSDLTGTGGFNKGGNISNYQAGSYQLGSIPQDQAAAVEARNQALRTTAAENIRNGRNYNDLFA